MKNFSICTIFVILIIFCSPLLNIKNDYKNMEYEQIGNTMLSNLEPFISNLDETANLANKATEFATEVFTSIKKGIDYVGNILTTLYNKLPSWLIGKDEEEEKEIICTEANGHWYCEYEDGTPYYGENTPTEKPCTGLSCDL